jgi:hypothetical protein
MIANRLVADWPGYIGAWSPAAESAASITADRSQLRLSSTGSAYKSALPY